MSSVLRRAPSPQFSLDFSSFGSFGRFGCFGACGLFSVHQSLLDLTSEGTDLGYCLGIVHQFPRHADRSMTVNGIGSSGII